MDAFIRQDAQEVTIREPGEVAHRLVVGQHASHSILNITSGSLDLGSAGSEVLKGHLYVAWSGVGEVTGIVNLSGGSLRAHWFNTMTNSAGDVAQLNISGTGHLRLGGLSVGGGHTHADEQVSIRGSAASVSILTRAIFEAHSTLRFTLDGSGVSAIHTDELTVDPTAKLEIDFGNYIHSGSGTDVILLAKANIFATPFAESNVSYENTKGLRYQLIQDVDNSNSIYVAIPEAGTSACAMGLLALCCVLRARSVRGQRADGPMN